MLIQSNLSSIENVFLKCMSLFTHRHKKDFAEVSCTPKSKELGAFNSILCDVQSVYKISELIVTTFI